MLSIVRQPIEVAVHADPSGLTVLGASLIALAGSLLIASAAVFAAWLAARTANARQEAQLAADFDRLKQQLAHERKLRSQEHARDSIDSLVLGVHEGLLKLSTLDVPVFNKGAERAALRDQIEDEDLDKATKRSREEELAAQTAPLQDASIDILEHSQQMLALETSLQLRLPAGDSIIGQYKRFKKQYDEFHDLARKGISDTFSEEDEVVVSRAHEGLESALHDLMQSCHSWFIKVA